MTPKYIEKIDADKARQVLTPHAIAQVAWEYALKVVERASVLRLQEVKQLSRAVRYLYAEFQSRSRNALTPMLFTRLVKLAEEIRTMHSMDFTIFYYTSKNEVSKQAPDGADLELRTNAFIACGLCKCVRAYEKRVREELKEQGLTIRPLTLIDELYDCMDAFCGSKALRRTINYDNAIKKFMQNIDNITYELN